MEDRQKKGDLTAVNEGGTAGDCNGKLFEDKAIDTERPLADEPDAKDNQTAEGMGKAGEQAADVPEKTSVEDDIEDLKKMLAEERSRVEEYFNRLVRMQADFENYRKRVAREKEDFLKYANEQLILALLPVVDNFERALSVENNDYGKLLEGVEMINRQLQNILAKEGVEAIPAVGQQFNPEYHEAVMKEESEEYPENTVIEELRRGYIYKGKVIRPAMVKVAG